MTHKAGLLLSLLAGGCRCLISRSVWTPVKDSREPRGQFLHRNKLSRVDANELDAECKWISVKCQRCVVRSLYFTWMVELHDAHSKGILARFTMTCLMMRWQITSPGPSGSLDALLTKLTSQQWLQLAITLQMWFYEAGQVLHMCSYEQWHHD